MLIPANISKEKKNITINYIIVVKIVLNMLF